MALPQTVVHRLHAPAKADRLVDAGSCPRPGGGVEAFTVHSHPDGRTSVRVEHRRAESSPDDLPDDLPGGSLWHLVLAPDAQPERVEARWREGDATFEAALTFFPDEVLVWRRGAEPISQSLALPIGYRLQWPPVAGRELFLAELESLPDDDQAQSTMPMCILSCKPLSEGGLEVRSAHLGAWPDAGETSLVGRP